MRHVSQRPRILFVSPVMPARTGNGLAMRAGCFLEALAQDHEVVLVVVPVAGPTQLNPVPDVVQTHAQCTIVKSLEGRADRLYTLIQHVTECEGRLAISKRYARPAMSRFATQIGLELTNDLQSLSFEKLFVFRLYMVPYVESLLLDERRLENRMLDLDEDDVGTCRRTSALYEQNGDSLSADIERVEADKFADLEQRYLAAFDSLTIASPFDKQHVEERRKDMRVDVIPNCVEMPLNWTDLRGEGVFNVLFVGTLNYYPNTDAIQFLCEEILPRLRKLVPRDVRVQVVGAGDISKLQHVKRFENVLIVNNAPDVSTFYASADVVVSPLRAGGGTRIKVLEAFAHKRPVVSTSIGAEGIEVQDGVHLLIADRPNDFAAACARIYRDPHLAESLVTRAYEVVASQYGREATIARIRSLVTGYG